MTKAMEILNEVNAIDKKELYRPEVIKDILTVLNVYEYDIVDTMIPFSDLIVKKYDKILQFLKESILNKRKQTYDVICVTANMGSQIVYSYDLIYNNYIINDIKSIVSILDDDNIIDIIINEKEANDLTKSRIVIPYIRTMSTLKRATVETKKDFYLWDYCIDFGINYEFYDDFNKYAKEFFDKESYLEMDYSGNTKYKLTEADCKRVLLFNNMCIDMGITADWLVVINEKDFESINHKHRTSLFMHYINAMKNNEVRAFMKLIKGDE